MQKWDRKEKLMVVATVLTLISILISAWFIKAQIKQGPKLNRRAAMESQSNDFLKLQMVAPAITCILDDGDIDEDCTRILKGPTNRRQALRYVSEVLQFFHEIEEFSKEDDGEYAKEHRQWVHEISGLDVTGFFLFTHKINAGQALKEFSVTVTDENISRGYMRFKQRLGLRDHANGRHR